MATISQIKVGGTSYDIKATYDGNGNTITSYYVKKSGDTMTGALTLTQGSYVHSASGTSGTTGYVQVCELIISASYQNHPIEIGFSRRGDSGMTRLYIAFKNVNGVDPELNYFRYMGATNAAYLVKSATSTWHLYIAKTEGYDNINIIEYHKPQYMTGTSVTWTNVHATTLPAGYVQATPGGTVSNATMAATWDTARTLTIGNKGQSVNGSADVSWALKDIQASPQYNVGDTSNCTYVLVTLNKETSWMYNFTLRLYQSYTAIDIQISGYNYGTNHWYSPQAVILGSTTTSAIKVYFGYTANWKLWVAVDGGNYSGASVFGLTNGYTQAVFENAVTLTKVSALPGTTQSTITAYRPYYRNETVSSATSATTASKLGSSTIGGASTPIYLNGGTPTAVAHPASGAWFTGVPYVASDGVMEIGAYIDFHTSNTNTNDYNVRLQGTASGLVTSVNDVSARVLRNISTGTAAPSGGSNGDIYIKYS